MKEGYIIIKWLFKTAFRITRYLVWGRFRPEKVKFNGKVITDKNFVVLNSAFAKDDTTAYFKSAPFSYADVPSFEAVDDHYAKDKDKVYYCDEYREGKNYYLTKKQTIQELRAANPASFVSIGHGYAKDRNHAWFQGRVFAVTNLSSLTSIDRHFAKDDVRAYLNLQAIAGSHGKTFELIDRNFARDQSNVYYYGYTGEGNHDITILPCEQASFEVLDYRYSKDASHVFFLGFTIDEADPATFAVLSEGYSKDKNNVYFESRKLAADPGSFRVYKENGMFGHDVHFARDARSVFMDDRKIREADLATFRVLGENYASDQHHVYYMDRVVKNANPKSFQVYPHDMGNADAEDAHHKYHSGSEV